MTRIWFGLGLLAVLLAAALGVMWATEEIQAPISRLLDQAAVSAAAGDWDQAEALSGEARTRWQQHWHFDAAVADHQPMEEVDALFAEVDVYCQMQEVADFSAACAHLSRLTEAMADAHRLNWWSLL